MTPEEAQELTPEEMQTEFEYNDTILVKKMSKFMQGIHEELLVYALTNNNNEDFFVIEGETEKAWKIFEKYWIAKSQVYEIHVATK